MGTYVEVKDKPKWLIDNSLEFSLVPPSEHYDRDKNAYWVCLINNGPFYAAGIAYSENELKAFSEPDHRPKVWHLVPLELLYQVSNIKNYLRN